MYHQEYPGENLHILQFLVERRHRGLRGAGYSGFVGLIWRFGRNGIRTSRTAGVLRNDQCFHVTPTQAELVKYTKNSFYALSDFLQIRCTTFVRVWARIGRSKENHHNQAGSANWSESSRSDFWP